LLRSHTVGQRFAKSNSAPLALSAPPGREGAKDDDLPHPGRRGSLAVVRAERRLILRTKLAVVGKAALLGAQLRRRYDASTTPKTARDSLESLACGLSLPLSKQLQALKGSQQEGSST
jgi:hypothetical protein